jgi:hypothetical protein
LFYAFVETSEFYNGKNILTYALYWASNIQIINDLNTKITIANTNMYFVKN